ncbi:MAG: hypothetical protein J1F25_01855 [Prevotellaceae bacterium]|nr:hypothetical protein [Prevotellaceae bacterium]
MRQKKTSYTHEFIGIEDVELEEVDLELGVLFPDAKANESGNTIENH